MCNNSLILLKKNSFAFKKPFKSNCGCAGFVYSKEDKSDISLADILFGNSEVKYDNYCDLHNPEMIKKQRIKRKLQKSEKYA
jgi:hypothetical protein